MDENPFIAIKKFFSLQKYCTPDHKYKYTLSIDQFNLHRKSFILKREGAVYVYCLAGMERSPLVCGMVKSKKS